MSDEVTVISTFILTTEDEGDPHQELPPRMKQVLELRDQAMSYNEIAELLGISKSAVASQLWLARRRGFHSHCDRRWAKNLRKVIK